MPVVTIKVDCSSRWVEHVEVTLPEGVTEKEATAIVEKKLETMSFDDNLVGENAEIDNWSFRVKPAFAEPGPLVFPNDKDLTLEWNGRRWATTGVFAIREDAICPVDDEGWIRQQEKLASLLTRLQVTEQSPQSMRFSTRFAALLRSGKQVVVQWDRVSGLGLLDEDGQLKAIVMPHHGSVWDTVDCYGQPKAKNHER